MAFFLLDATREFFQFLNAIKNTLMVDTSQNRLVTLRFNFRIFHILVNELNCFSYVSPQSRMCFGLLHIEAFWSAPNGNVFFLFSLNIPDALQIYLCKFSQVLFILQKLYLICLKSCGNFVPSIKKFNTYSENKSIVLGKLLRIVLYLLGLSIENELWKH